MSSRYAGTGDWIGGWTLGSQRAALARPRARDATRSLAHEERPRGHVPRATTTRLQRKRMRAALRTMPKLDDPHINCHLLAKASTKRGKEP